MGEQADSPSGDGSAAGPADPADTDPRAITAELADIARGVDTFGPGVRGARSAFSQWVSLGITSLLQRTGHNARALQRLDPSTTILNVGCAGDINAQCVNADLFPNVGELARIARRGRGPSPDLYVNLESFDRHLVGVADGIVCSHVLEHLSPGVVSQAVGNLYAYLKPGGHLRVCVPCIDTISGDSSSTYRDATSMLERTRILYCHGHRFTYNAALLIVILEAAGFVDVSEVQFGEGPLGDIDLPERKDESIYVIGTKPSAIRPAASTRRG